MSLLSKLKRINEVKRLNSKTFLRVYCFDGSVVDGYYSAYTSELDNTPEEAQLDIVTTRGNYIGILEHEIKEIEVIA